MDGAEGVAMSSEVMSQNFEACAWNDENSGEEIKGTEAVEF